ncbi:MAG: LD-carboxypeptidase [Burkholderiales bacterium]|nr:LD-carboxypeptidase [Betaproteobacteria bacterium]
MNRRDLLLAASAAVSSFVAPRAIAAPNAPQSIGRLTRAASIIKPRKLKQGGLIGLVAPSGGSNPAYVEARVKHLEGLGFRVKLSKNILAVRGNTAGTRQQRVADLHDMFRDREVDAIWALRGGSGASQMLPLIDYRLIRNNPKIFIGFSDITALHLAILKHSGLVTFHGPTAPGPTISDYSMTQLQAVLMHPRDQTTIYMSDANRVEAENAVPGAAEYKLRTLTPGVAEGRLIGGNLAVLSALIGTPYAPDWRGALLFLEEIREAPYRIDRMLTQLKQSIPFNDAAGVMLGVFRRSIDAGATADGEPRLLLEQAIDDHFAGLRVPAVYGFSFGHITNNFTIPLGVRARLDTGAQTLTLLEAAVTAQR